jgi:PleD family two-component response regulator
VRVARFSGQRFLLTFSELEMAAAASLIETCRQTIASAHFEREDLDIRVTVSCALTAARVDDSPSSVLLRVESALGESKRYGRNRTFRHDGKYPAPVVPPELQLDPLHVAI